jgi:hypothetical protein
MTSIDSEFPVENIVWKSPDGEEAAVLWLSPRTRTELRDAWRELEARSEGPLSESRLYGLIGTRLLALLCEATCTHLDCDG